MVVVNFLNQKNEADQRVFQLLSEKFYLFEGVFGASDEVLGAIELGVDFERRIADIYQRCRTSDEIEASFDQLQHDLSAEVDAAMTRTRPVTSRRTSTKKCRRSYVSAWTAAGPISTSTNGC